MSTPADQDLQERLFGAVRAGDVAGVRRLVAAGANPRLDDGRETALHVAARRGPVAVVEALIEGGALDWQPDRNGAAALDAARQGDAEDRAAIIALLDRHSIADPSFRAAVSAVQTGDVLALERLLDAEPRLLREHIVGPDVYRRAPRRWYFTDPKLFWHVANNPTLVERMAPNMAEIARAMIGRGVVQADLDTALALTMTSSAAREQGQQLPLMRVLLGAGACPGADAIVTAAGHGELEALRALLSGGQPLTLPIAAALGDNGYLAEVLPVAALDDVQTAFGLGAINRQGEAVRLALGAGADIDAALPVHAHSTALHQAVSNDDLELLQLLLDRGARTDLRDSLWDGTALDWAGYLGRAAARSVLEKHDADRLEPGAP